MNNTTLTSWKVFDPSSDFVIHPNVRISIVIMGIFVLIISTPVLLFLWMYLGTATSPLTNHIRCLVLSSLFGATIGQSIALVAYATDFHLHSYEVCKRFRVAALSIHFWSNITNLVLLTAVSIERRFIAKMTNTNSSNSKDSKRRRLSLLASVSLALLIAILLFFHLHIRYEADYSRNECALAFHREMTKCKGLFAPCSGFPIVITVTATITGCSFILYAMTKKLKQKIAESDERISAALKKARVTNTKRIQATNYLWIASTIEWVPYGIARLTIYADVSLSTFFSISGIFHTFSTLFFLSLPIIYYQMDRKFHDFVNLKSQKLFENISKGWKETVDEVQVI